MNFDDKIVKGTRTGTVNKCNIKPAQRKYIDVVKGQVSQDPPPTPDVCFPPYSKSHLSLYDPPSKEEMNSDKDTPFPAKFEEDSEERKQSESESKAETSDSDDIHPFTGKKYTPLVPEFDKDAVSKKVPEVGPKERVGKKSKDSSRKRPSRKKRARVDEKAKGSVPQLAEEQKSPPLGAVSNKRRGDGVAPRAARPDSVQAPKGKGTRSSVDSTPKTRQNKKSDLIAGSIRKTKQEDLGKEDALKEMASGTSDVELIWKARDGTLLEGKEAESARKAVQENNRLFDALKELESVQTARLQVRAAGEYNNVSSDYHSRHEKESIEVGHYGPYKIESEHTSYRGGVNFILFCLFQMVVTFFVWMLCGVLAFYTMYIFAFIVFLLYLMVLAILVPVVFWPRKSKTYCERTFSFQLSALPEPQVDLRVENYRAQKANLTPKLAQMTYDSWTNVNPTLLKRNFNFTSRGFMLSWVQEGALVARFELDLTEWKYFNYGQARSVERTTVSVEKYLQLIVPQNVSPLRSMELNREIIRRKSSTMPGINVDKRHPLKCDVEDATILAACLYAEHLRSSPTGKNQIAQSSGSSLVSNPLF